MSRDPHFRSSITSLWFRLITLAIVSLVFSESLFLAAGRAEGWSYYLTGLEVAFEVLVRLVAAALAGIALGTICTALVAPFLWHFQSSREHVARVATQVAIVVALFLVSRYALEVLITWSHPWFVRGPRFYAALRTAHFLAFAAALYFPRARTELVSSLDGILGEKMTRRTAIATVAGTAALVTAEFVLGKTSSVAAASLGPLRPKSNILLITFDALCAEDMSLYGRPVPTTPNIDAFARKGTVFANFYSASSSTTPGIATILTGVYPSDSYVYQLQGRVSRDHADKSLPHVMRAAGYATGAFLSNPFAYYLVKGLESEFDVLPEPPFQAGAVQHVWEATRPLHQDSGFGSRIDEYIDLDNVWNFFGRGPGNQALRFRPFASFEHARQVFARLPDGFFLWVHLVTPHEPYLPDPADRGRFLPDSELRTYEEESGGRWTPHYQPDQQSQVDQRRLRYDEFIATADRAFANFMSDLENAGRMQDTTVIVSADHGESFEGGIYQHNTPYLTRPVLHIPLIIRTPGQQESRRIAFTADQTTLAPTILELAGLAKPDWMRGQSLAGWLNRDGQGEGEGLAFAQYLETNSVFEPLRRGTVSVIDGKFEYVVDLTSQSGLLRPLDQAQIWNLDRSGDHLTKVEALRAALHSRFPDLV
jgi:arylsulfatase A-like enzyme